MLYTLINGDIIDLKNEDGKILADKLDKSGKNLISSLAVSRNMVDCCNPICFPLSNGGFFIFWLSKVNKSHEIYGRRYTAQGLAGKVLKFPIINLAKNVDLKIELEDDFFFIIKWQTFDRKIYKKKFNQDADEKGEEEFVELVKEEERENITFLVSSENTEHEPKQEEPKQEEPKQEEPKPPIMSTIKLSFNKLPPLERVTTLPPINQQGFSFQGRKRTPRGNMFMNFKK